MYLAGARVVRGPDWVWGEQDGGLGCIGTVLKLGEPGSKHTPDNTVVVCWDSGLRSNYRTGYQGQYDLVMVDNAQCGIIHASIECNSCKQAQILGMRYKCSVCNDYDLCFLCYHSDMHDLEHVFLRFDYRIARGVKLTPRSRETKIVLRGIFPGAIVQRGNDWKWDDQDGGPGSAGIVTDIINWATESCRSVARVKWKNGKTNDYRVGHKGVMDLKFVKPGLGGNCYTSHCPIYGKAPDEATLQGPVGGKKRAEGSETGLPRLYPGDRVRVVLDVDTLRHLQQGHGGWNPRMADYIGKIGIVHRVTERGDIRVQHEGCPNRWTFHPAALVAVVWYRKGDVVRFIESSDVVQRLQHQHGEWVAAMAKALGKTARVMHVYSDGDLRIEIIEDENQQKWTVNPDCVTLVQRYPVVDNPPPPPSSDAQPPFVAAPVENKPTPDQPEMRVLMSKVAQGDLQYVKKMYETEKSIINTPYCGKTILQVAAYQGHRALVQFLLSKGGSPSAVDDEGDSVLHDAAFGNQPEILEILLTNKDVDINAVNRSHCTALHIAAHKCLPHCVWILLQNKPNVNLQDTYGDTALHDAINNSQSMDAEMTTSPSDSSALNAATNSTLTGAQRIIQMLLAHPDINCGLTNKRGFNALQHAALKGNAFACTAICGRFPDLVDLRKEDGFSALHLASLNGHAEAVNALVLTGSANVNLRNNRNQTPLLLAISQGHCIVTEQLIKLGCDITAKDEDDNTALHIAYMKRTNTHSSEAQKPSRSECPEIYSIFTQVNRPEVGPNAITYSILIYLIRLGCDINSKNKEGRTLFDLMNNDENGKKVIMELQQATPHNGLTIDGGHSLPESQLNRNLQNFNISTGSAESFDNSDERLSSNVGSPIPSNNLEGFYFGANVGVNVNASPSKRPNFNLINGECSSSNNSPIHYPSNLMGKTNNTASPARPSRVKKSSPPPANNSVPVSRAKPTECVVCCELSEANCLLEPCGHRPACEDCTARMKKCLTCGMIIERRLTTDGRTIQCRSRQPSAERLRYLECKIQEIEEAHCCPICMERRRTVAFLCGHGACAKCAATLTTCHMCRQDIVSRINLY